MASRDSTMMAFSVMLRAASMPAAARSASCRSSMKAMYDRSGSSLITARTAICKSRQPSSWGSRPTRAAP